jgi:sugar phosphate isomerase/epimerase
MDVSRISACSYPLQKQDLEYTFRVISEAGFRKVDLLARMPHFSVSDPTFSLETLKGLSRQYRLRVANIGSYCGQGFSSPSEADRRAAMEDLRKTLDTAQELGARSIRVTPGDGKRSSLDALVPHFREAAEHAEKVGISMGIENHGGEISGDPEACAEIARKVGSKRFGVLYEPANLMAAGVDYRKAWETFREHVVHVHIKDGAYNRDGKWERVMLGDGVIDLRWVWDRMEGLGYTGDYALEFEVGHIEPVETGYRKWYEVWEKA